MRPNRATHRRRGATLIEVSVSALISGMLLCGALATVGGVFRTKRMAAEKIDAANLAQQLMAEVLAAPYSDPNQADEAIGLEAGESGATRADFDDVDDYALWASMPPQDKSGASLGDYTGWRRTVAVDFVDSADGSTVTSTDSGLKRIVVTAQSPDGKTTTLSALRSKFGALEYTPGAAATYITSSSATLQTGDMMRPVSSASNLLNHATD